jgi:hypothetical protein
MSNLLENVSTFPNTLVPRNYQLNDIQIQSVGKQADLSEFVADVVVSSIDIGHSWDAENVVRARIRAEMSDC